MSESNPRKNLQRIIIIASSLALVGVGVVPFLGQLTGQSQSNTAETSEINNNLSAEENQQLQTMEKGYEAVLKREPNNQSALQGLVQVRTQMNHFHSAKEPMEKLVALEPENPGYLQALAQINLKNNDIEGALPPLEKLAKIYPDKPEIKEIIETLKKAQKGELPSQQAPATSPSNPDPAIPIPSKP